MELPVLDFAATMAALPPQLTGEGLDEAVREALAQRYDVVIVLDDDPTGTQTVYDVPVLTEISRTAIAAELRRGSPLFYLLTNSRSLPVRKAAKLARLIGKQIRLAAEKQEKRVLIVSRGDSTLRGHYPVEELALRQGMELEEAVDFIIPAFFEGGRYTIGDVHYVRDKDQLIPAAQTPFAKDSSFGYRHSRLQEWVAEKKRHLPAEAVWSLSLAEIRSPDPVTIPEKVQKLPPDDGVCIVNAANYDDLKRALLGILQSGVSPLFRTAASFVKALLGLPDRPLLTFPQRADRGGLLVVGSHVPLTTAQLAHLRAEHQLREFEVDVRALLFTKTSPASRELAQKIGLELTEGHNVLLFTSREVITTAGVDANLNIAATVSAYLEAVVAALSVAPAFLLTKGGITSSRIATESLDVRRAMVLGQVLPGVPAWSLGPESKFPGMPFIIFPGNVGEADSLSRILQNTFI